MFSFRHFANSKMPFGISALRNGEMLKMYFWNFEMAKWRNSNFSIAKWRNAEMWFWNFELAKC
jgi:hypothetical protein